MKQYFGIDIGGTAVKLGVVDETGKVLCKGEQSVNFDGYQTPVLDTVRKAAKEFLTAQAIPVENLSGIGVSATGQIDSRKGIVAGTCGNFPNYIGSPIKAALEKDFGLPVTVANDANCMTLGEVWVGAAQGYTDVIGVTLGTGVGGGILTGGHLLEGARGLGGELGHFRLHALDGVACTCGAIGCYERYAATTALVRGAQKMGLYLASSLGQIALNLLACVILVPRIGFAGFWMSSWISAPIGMLLAAALANLSGASHQLPRKGELLQYLPVKRQKLALRESWQRRRR